MSDFSADNFAAAMGNNSLTITDDEFSLLIDDAFANGGELQHLDTLAIDAAIDAAFANSTGAVVPNGNQSTNVSDTVINSIDQNALVHTQQQHTETLDGDNSLSSAGRASTVSSNMDDLSPQFEAPPTTNSSTGTIEVENMDELAYLLSEGQNDDSTPTAQSSNVGTAQSLHFVATNELQTQGHFDQAFHAPSSNQDDLASIEVESSSVDDQLDHVTQSTEHAAPQLTAELNGTTATNLARESGQHQTPTAFNAHVEGPVANGRASTTHSMPSVPAYTSIYSQNTMQPGTIASGSMNNGHSSTTFHPTYASTTPTYYGTPTHYMNGPNGSTAVHNPMGSTPSTPFWQGNHAQNVNTTHGHRTMVPPVSNGNFNNQTTSQSQRHHATDPTGDHRNNHSNRNLPLNIMQPQVHHNHAVNSDPAHVPAVPTTSTPAGIHGPLTLRYSSSGPNMGANTTRNQMPSHAANSNNGFTSSSYPAAYSTAAQTSMQQAPLDPAMYQYHQQNNMHPRANQQHNGYMMPNGGQMQPMANNHPWNHGSVQGQAQTVGDVGQQNENQNVPKKAPRRKAAPRKKASDVNDFQQMLLPNPGQLVGGLPLVPTQQPATPAPRARGKAAGSTANAMNRPGTSSVQAKESEKDNRMAIEQQIAAMLASPGGFHGPEMSPAAMEWAFRKCVQAFKHGLQHGVANFRATLMQNVMAGTVSPGSPGTTSEESQATNSDAGTADSPLSPVNPRKRARSEDEVQSNATVGEHSNQQLGASSVEHASAGRATTGHATPAHAATENAATEHAATGLVATGHHGTADLVDQDEDLIRAAKKRKVEEMVEASMKKYERKYQKRVEKATRRLSKDIGKSDGKARKTGTQEIKTINDRIASESVGLNQGSTAEFMASVARRASHGASLAGEPNLSGLAHL